MSDVNISLRDTLDRGFGVELTAKLEQLSALSKEFSANMSAVGRNFSAASKTISSSSNTSAKSTDTLNKSISNVSTSVDSLIQKTKTLSTAERDGLKSKQELLSLYRSTATQILNIRTKLDLLRTSIRESSRADSEKARLLTLLNREYSRLNVVMRTVSSQIGIYNSAVLGSREGTNSFRQKLIDLSIASSLLGNRFGSTAASITLGVSALKSLGPVAAAVVAGIGSIAIALKGLEVTFNTFVKTVEIGISAATNEFAEFNVKLTAANVAAGGTATTFKILNDIAKETALDFKFSSNEMADALLILSRAGFTVNEQINTLPAVSALAAGGFSTLQTSTDLLTTTIRAFGLSTEQSLEVANAIVATVNNSKTSIEGLRQSFGFAAVTAAQFGLEINDLLTALAVLADSGLRPSTQATGFRGFLATLAKGTKQFKDELERVGLTMHDVNVQTLGLSQVIHNLANAVHPVTGAVFDADVAFQGLERRIAPVSLALVKGANSYDAFKQNITGTDAAIRGSAAAMATLDGQMKLLVNTLENLKIEIGEELEPALKRFIKLVLDSRSELQVIAAAIASVSQFTVELVSKFAFLLTSGGQVADLIRELLALFDLMAKSLFLIADQFLDSAQQVTKLWRVMAVGNETVAKLDDSVNKLRLSLNTTALIQSSMSSIFEKQLSVLEQNRQGYEAAGAALKGYDENLKDAVFDVNDLIVNLEKTSKELENKKTVLDDVAEGILEASGETAGLKAEQEALAQALETTVIALKQIGLTSEQVTALNLLEAKSVEELVARLEGLNTKLRELQKEKRLSGENVSFEVDADINPAREKLQILQKEGDATKINLKIELPTRSILGSYARLIHELEQKRVTVGLTIREEETLKRLKDRLKQFSEEEKVQVKVEADTLPALKDIKELFKELKKEDFPIPLTVEEEKLLRQVEEFLEAVGELEGTLIVDANTAKALDKVNLLMEEIERRQSEVTISADTVPAKKSLEKLRADIEAGKIEVDANTKKALDKLIEFEETVNRSSPTVIIDADTRKALNKVNNLLDIVEEKSASIDVDADTEAAHEKFDHLEQVVDRISAKAEGLGGFSNAFDNFPFTEEDIISQQTLEEQGIQIPPHLAAWDRFIRLPGIFPGQWRWYPVDDTGSLPLGGGLFAEGGRVESSLVGSNLAGFGGGDRRFATLLEGSYVLNKDTTAAFDSLVSKLNRVPVLLEDGEKILSPQEARHFGYEALNKINATSSSQEILRHLLDAKGFNQGGTVTTDNSNNYWEDNKKIDITLPGSAHSRQVAKQILRYMREEMRLSGN